MFRLLRSPKQWAVTAMVLVLLSSANSYEAFASRTIYESFLANDPYRLEIVGALPGGQFGASITKGDFNGDGVEDLAISSPFASTNLRQWNGSVSIIFGREQFKERYWDLTQAGPDVSFYGATSGDQLGSVLSAGDFNGDGIDDLFIGSYNALNQQTRPGQVYGFFGRSEWQKKSFDLKSAESEVDLTFVGYGDGDRFGMEVELLDLNNDKVQDLLIGAPNASTPDITNAGMVYAFWGGNKLNGMIQLKERLADVSFYGHEEGESFGSEIAGGRLTADGSLVEGLTDLAIGAYKADVDGIVDAGKVYIYKGNEQWLSAEKTPINVIKGQHQSGWFGFEVEVGDIDGDWIADIAISSFPFASGENDGRVMVYLGGERFNYHDLVFLEHEKFADMVIKDPVGEAFLGASLALGDLDGDGRDDILAGAPGIGNPISYDEGEVYGIYTKFEEAKSEFSIKDNTVTSFIYGAEDDDWCGYSIEILDFDNDGFQDAVVGCRYSDNGVNANVGRLFVLFGDGTPFGESFTVLDPGDKNISRGEFIEMVVQKFELREKKADFIANCYAFREFCLFNFTTVSGYEDIQLEPELVLYPDVKPGDKYYDSVVTATLLGLVNGYTDKENTPFGVDDSISRIQALKVVLTATELVDPKYKFELVEDLGGYQGLINQRSYFSDIDAQISHMWWYPRYVSFAVDHSIVEDGEFFRPDDKVTVSEVDEMIQKTLDHLKELENEKANS